MTEIAVLIGTAVVSSVLIKLVLKRWPQKGKWAIVRSAIKCPKCGLPSPKVRRPANRRQMLWGGNTCTHCGTEYDKHGNLVGQP